MLKESLQLPTAILAMLTLTGALVVAFTPPPVAPLAPGSTPPTPYTGTYAASLYIPTPPPSDCGDWQRFGSEAELRARLAVLYPYPIFFDTRMGGVPPPSAEQSTTSPMAGGAGTPSGAPPDYTGTNVQVVGVDEPDVVKTDGWYVYTVGPGGVTILRAYPLSELAVVSTISLEGAWPSGIFVNGNYLVILATGYGGVYAVGGDTRESFAPYYYEPSTTVLVYDISNPSRPALAANLTMSGYQVGARMIGNEVFVVSTYWMYLYDGNITLPTLTVDGTVHTVAAADIGYFPEAHNSSSVTEVLVFNLTHPKDAHMTALLADAGSTLYMSRDSIYLVGYGSRYSASTGAWVDASTLHRLYLWKGKVSCAVTGEIAGHVLNQYSLDEFDGHLRVATTEWTDGRQTANHVIILDGSLKMTGSIDDLAPGETIQAVRFLGERGYVVTFRQVDPFFVVDLKDPAAPKVLGELKITGFSQYLHPVGANLILGIGPETTAPDSTGRTQRVGLKLSLFDVADVAHPIEKSKFVIEGSYVSSTVQWDAHALLWVPSRSLLAIPVDIYEYSSWDYATSSYWQGVYVFSVTPQSGIQQSGRVAHDDAVEKSAYGYYGVSPIRRALQVGEYLYTVSDTTLQVYGIDSLQVVGRLKFWSPPPYTGCGPMMEGGVSSPCAY